MPTELNIPWEPESGFFHEDGFLCCNNKHILEENGIRFPDINIAKFFSHESMIQEIEGITPFSFHKWQGSNKKYPGYWLDKITW